MLNKGDILRYIGDAGYLKSALDNGYCVFDGYFNSEWISIDESPMSYRLEDFVLIKAVTKSKPDSLIKKTGKLLSWRWV